MSYNKKVWKSGDRITKEALNNMENGIEAAHQNSGGTGSVAIVDNLNSDSSTSALSAKQGKELNNKMPAKSIVEGGKIYLAKEDGTKLDSGTQLPASSSTPYDDTAIKTDINTIKTDLGTAQLTTTNKDIKGAINEVNAQYKDIAKKTVIENNKLYLIKADGTKIDEGTVLSIKDNTNNVFYGRTACFFGDSLTEVNERYTKGYHKWIQENLGLASYENYARGGRETYGVYEEVVANPTTADLIFCMFGVNDITLLNTPLGTIDDTTRETLYGELNILCNHIKTTYPKKLIIFITPHNVIYNNSVRTDGVTIRDFADAMIDVCRKYAIPVYDNYQLCGINKYNLNYWTSDNIHWNDKAHKMVGMNISSWMLNTFKYLVTENNIPSTNISLNKTKIVLTENKTSDTLTATLTPSDSTDSIIWTSDNSSIATITGNGKTVTINGIKTGNTTITATTTSKKTITIPINVNINTTPIEKHYATQIQAASGYYVDLPLTYGDIDSIKMVASKDSAAKLDVLFSTAKASWLGINNNAWANCTCDLQLTEFIGAGKKTITLVPNNMQSAQSIRIGWSGGESGAITIYNISFYKNNVLVANLYPTNVLGEMKDTITNKTYSYNHINAKVLSDVMSLITVQD